MEKLINNRKYLSEKRTSRRYSEMQSPSDLMLGCADSDFQIPKAMMEDLTDVISHGDMSYTYWTEEILAAVNVWYKRKYNTTFDDEEFITGSGVIHLMQVAVETMSKPGDKVIIQTPVYGSFAHVVTRKNRILVNNKLIYDKNQQKYFINFSELETQMKDPAAKIIIMCSPHNPAGRVWTKEELKHIYDLATANNVFIISDEIWQDVIFAGHRHCPFFEVEDKAQNVICLSSQGKTYNIGGAQIGYGLSHNKKLIANMKTVRWASIDYATTNYMGANMLISGYTNKRNWEWQELYVAQMEKNFKKFKKEIEAKTKIKVINSEGFYLAWMDFSEVVKTKDELVKRLSDAHIFGSFGSDFADEDVDLMARFVIGVADETLDMIIERFVKHFK